MGLRFHYRQLKMGLILLLTICCHTDFFSFYFAFSISEAGDSTASLGNLLHCLTTHGKNLIHDFKWNFMSFNLCPFCLVLSLNTTDKSLLPSSPGFPLSALSTSSCMGDRYSSSFLTLLGVCWNDSLYIMLFSFLVKSKEVYMTWLINVYESSWELVGR